MPVFADLASAPEPSALDRSVATCRVLHVVNGEHYAGAERVQDLLAEYLPREGVATGFACVKPAEFPKRRHFQKAPCWSVPVAHPWPRAAVRELAELAAGEAFGMMHAHTPRSLWAALPAARRMGVPVVYTMHDVNLIESDALHRQWIKRRTMRLLRQVDALIAVSPAALDIAERFGLGRHRQLIPNGVPCQARAKHSPRQDRAVVGTVALLRPRKGIETLIESIGTLRRAGSDIDLRLIGPFESREYERSIRRELARYDLRAEEVLTGFVSDVTSALCELDLFVMPSVLDEGLPMVVMEAMAVGLPVVGSRVAGVRDLIRHEVDGALVSPGEAKPLADAVRWALADSARWGYLSEQAYRRQQALFSAERMAHRTAELYRWCSGDQDRSAEGSECERNGRNCP